MRWTKRILATSAIALTLMSPNFLQSQDRASPFEPTIVHADEKTDKIVQDSMSGMVKLSSGQALTNDEKSALKTILTDPANYVTTQRSAEYVTMLKSTLQNKPNELGEATGLDPSSAFTGVQSQIAKWDQHSSNSSTQGQGSSLANGAVDGAGNARGLSHLKSNESYETLYASIIYSLSKGESADSTSISLSQLMKYPVQSSDDDQIDGDQYGSLASPGFGAEPQSAGKKLSSYIQTLHQYNYLVTKDKTGFSGFWDSLTSGTTAAIRVLLLNTAWMGAALYDFSMWGINWFVDSFTKFNLIEITGLGSAISGTDSWLNSMLKGMFSMMGLNSGVIRVIQYMFYIIIVSTFLITLITQLRKSKARKAITTLQRNGLKIFTIIMTIPLTAMMYTTTAAVFNSVKLAASDAQQLTSNYVINVTEWAGTMNMSLSPISTNAIASTGEADPTFEPTTANISKINAAINALKASSTVDENETAGKSARDQVQALISDKEATVQDYFNFIASRKTSGSGLAAEYLPIVSSTSSNSAATRTYLLVSRDKKDDATEVIKKILGIDDNNSSGSLASGSVAPSYTYNVANMQKITIGLESKYDLTPVVWNNPTSYLYGAIQPGNLTSSTLNHGNYHLSAYTDMLNDPNTGDLASEDALSKALAQNAINLAVINKYAGVSYSGSMRTLSSQSLAFLLQSKLSNGTLVYKGYNTAANSSGASKNTGAYGITYVENVVPSTGLADYMSKIAGINAVWLSAGITAFVVFLSLMKAPVLGSVMQHLKCFASALFTGNAISLIESMMYYIALASSFLFAYISTIACLYLVSSMLNNTFLSFVTFIPTAGPIILSWVIMFMLTWPIVKLRLGVSNKQRKVGLASLLVSVPYILVESLDEYFDRFNHALYGKSKRQSFGSKMARQAAVIDQGDQAKKLAKKGVNVAVGAGRMLMGDMTGAAQVAKGVIGNGDQNDPNALNKTGSLLGNAASAAAGAVLGKEAGDVVGAIAGTVADQREDDFVERDTSLKHQQEDTIEQDFDPSLEKTSALRTSGIEKEIDESMKRDGQEDDPNAKDQIVPLDATRDDSSKLDEIADNTRRLLDKDQQVDLVDSSLEKDKDIDDRKEIVKTEVDQVKTEGESESIDRDQSNRDDQIVKTSSPIDQEIVKDKVVDSSMRGQTENSKSDVTDGILEQFKNIKDGGIFTVNAAGSAIERVTDSSIGRNISDSIESVVTGKPLEQVKLEKHSERFERDVQKEIVRQEKQENRQTAEKVVERFHSNVTNNQNALQGTPFDSEALTKGLAGIQTAMQTAKTNPVVNTTTKIIQQAAKPLAFGADNILFDGEKVLGNAIKGVKTSEIGGQSDSPRSSRQLEAERFERRNRDSEHMIDAIDELTNELRSQRYSK